MMAITMPRVQSFPTRDLLAESVAELVAQSLRDALESRDRASLLVSGGSTPKAMFQLLSGKELDWSKVDIGLVDERFVPDTHAASNAKLVTETLLQGAAASARFVPMVASDDLVEAASMSSESYRALLPATCLVLGLGSDGHTASWYPGASNLSDAFRTTDQPIVAIDANGCPVAGEITDRLTLTRSAVAEAQSAILLLTGDKKKRVFEAAFSKSIEEAPILAAVEDLGDRLTTVWAP